MLSKAMQYEDIKPSKKVSKATTSKAVSSELDRFNTSTMLWHLVKRHKFGLLMTFTVIFVTFTLFGTLIVGITESLVR